MACASVQGCVQQTLQHCCEGFVAMGCKNSTSAIVRYCSSGSSSAAQCLKTEIVHCTMRKRHIGLGLRKVLKKVLKKALKKILLTQKRTQKSKCTFLSTQKSTQKFNFSECWVQKFTQKRSPKEILLKKVIYCPKLYSKKWTVFIPTYKYRWWHYPLVG